MLDYLVRGTTHGSCKTDVFSAASLLWELWAGRALEHSRDFARQIDILACLAPSERGAEPLPTHLVDYEKLKVPEQVTGEPARLLRRAADCVHNALSLRPAARPSALFLRSKFATVAAVLATKPALESVCVGGLHGQRFPVSKERLERVQHLSDAARLQLLAELDDELTRGPLDQSAPAAGALAPVHEPRGPLFVNCAPALARAAFSGPDMLTSIFQQPEPRRRPGGSPRYRRNP